MINDKINPIVKNIICHLFVWFIITAKPTGIRHICLDIILHELTAA